MENKEDAKKICLFEVINTLPRKSKKKTAFILSKWLDGLLT
jgi:hypothetical protein